MGHNASRRGAANLGVLLMAVTFIAILGFMYWLNAQARAERAARAAEVQETGTAAMVLDTAAVHVPIDEFQRDPESYAGQMIRLEGSTLTDAIGTQGYWMEFPNGNVFVLSLSEEAKGFVDGLTPGGQVTLVGSVHEMGDSALDAWSTMGSISENDRLSIEALPYFFQASGITNATSGGDGEG